SAASPRPTAVVSFLVPPTAPAHRYTLSLHDALPISAQTAPLPRPCLAGNPRTNRPPSLGLPAPAAGAVRAAGGLHLHRRGDQRLGLLRHRRCALPGSEQWLQPGADVLSGLSRRRAGDGPDHPLGAVSHAATPDPAREPDLQYRGGRAADAGRYRRPESGALAAADRRRAHQWRLGLPAVRRRARVHAHDTPRLAVSHRLHPRFRFPRPADHGLPVPGVLAGNLHGQRVPHRARGCAPASHTGGRTMKHSWLCLTSLSLALAATPLAWADLSPQDFVDKASAAGIAEIETARMALEQATSAEVK